ncbi:MAG: serine/threonine protein kinase [Planctomycetes bacterium]|nr:serine/threonine protein kinase [Planctomycetota bacterium]
MTSGEIDPTLPDQGGNENKTNEVSRSELEKETSAIARPDLSASIGAQGTTDRTVMAGPDVDIVPGYQMLSKLGEGGMGVVYKAIQRSLNREVALKVMKNLGNDESFVARFRREAITGARLNHPNIVSVFDHGHHQGSVYLVLEFVRGRNCSELLDEQGRLPVKDALEITRGAVLGLSHAHDQGVIHRDIKPANLMVLEGSSTDARRRRRLTAKVADFGLARLHDGRDDPDHQDLTQTGSVMGTPGYMAPEQALGKPVDFRADIYSLGSTLYCLITGTKPFQGNTVIEVLHKKINEFAVDPRDLVGDVPEGVVRVIDRMMAKSADDRYQSYENLLHDLDKLLAGAEPDTAPVEAHSRSIGPPAGKTITFDRSTQSRDPSAIHPGTAGGRKKGILMAVAAVLVLAIGGLAFLGGEDAEEPKGKGGGQGVGDGSDTTAPAIVAEVGRWEALPTAPFLTEAGDHWQALLTGIADLPADRGTELKERFRRRLGLALNEVASARARAFEEQWKSRAWPALEGDLSQHRALLELAGQEVPARLLELQAFCRAAAGGAATTEEARARALTDGQPSVADLEAFQRDFPFSPVRDLIAAKLRDLAAGGAKVDALTARLVELEARTPADLFADPAGLAALAAEIEKLEDAGQRRVLGDRLQSLRRQKGEAMLAGAARELESAHQARDFTSLRVKLATATTVCGELGLATPEWLARYEKIVAEATPNFIQREKVEWGDVQELKSDPVALIPKLEKYIETYAAISPSVAEAGKLLAEARDAAPLFTLEVEPRDARIKLNDVTKPGPKVALPMLPGDVRIMVEAPGYFPAERMVQHEAGKPASIKIVLMPRPAKRLSVQGSANVPLHMNPMDEDELPFPNVPGTALGIVVKPVAGIRFSSAKSDWRESRRSIFDNPIARQVFRDGRWSGWQLKGVLAIASGEAEIRVLDDPRGSCVVVGLAKGLVYLGERNGDELKQKIEVAIPADCQALRFALSWEGDLALLELTTGEDLLVGEPDRVVASLKPSYQPREKGELAIAVKKGEATFGELELYPMN